MASDAPPEVDLADNLANVITVHSQHKDLL
ncbi:MAG: hypothetical protein AVDCRST_MAG86-1801 [uncultured Truepera sp.]|uniref:Uncharacterized protein n=1 Tax=uncultured Truepera sp. TaxID=543023 RepID=A0A6J4V8X3_9DEIN|nr:MAG: hypothetical protein AVDCRST_MAG86-1801 [uncultured Truepera sp.]